MHTASDTLSLIGAVIDRDLVALAYPDRLAALLEARIGLWDVIATARRTGSGDAEIRDHDANDLATLIADMPSLRALAFNGGKALAIGTRQLGAAAPAIARVALPSSSPLHTVGLAAKLPAWVALRDFLAK